MTTSFTDIRRNTPFPISKYHINVGLTYLEYQLESMAEGSLLELDPDFQRNHVWSENQQIKYVEYLIQGGPSARVIYWACKGWNSVGDLGPVVLVDGKQRLEAVRRFMRNEIPIFGQLLSEYSDNIKVTGANLEFSIADIGRKDTLKWYIALNAGGTPHTIEEINKVQLLLEGEK